MAVMLIVCLLSACIEDVRPTAEDEARKAQLASTFGSRYEFEFEDIYLRAESKSGTPTQDDAVRIYNAFWVENGKPRTNSNLIYLNMYDDRDRFAFQTVWDPNEQRIVFSKTEHY